MGARDETRNTWVAKSSRIPSLLIPCSEQSCFQNSIPIWFPHCPTCRVMISRGMAKQKKSKTTRGKRQCRRKTKQEEGRQKIEEEEEEAESSIDRSLPLSASASDKAHSSCFSFALRFLALFFPWKIFCNSTDALLFADYEYVYKDVCFWTFFLCLCIFMSISIIISYWIELVSAPNMWWDAKYTTISVVTLCMDECMNARIDACEYS